MAPTAKRQPRPHPDDVRRAILDATLQLYVEKGYAGTNTDEIAAMSSVSKQTIYRHFADKDDLVRAAILSLIAAAEEQGAESFDALAESDDPERDLRFFARQHLHDVIQPDIMRMRRRIIAEVDRFPDVAKAWYDAAPPSNDGSLAGRRTVQLADPVDPNEPRNVRCGVGHGHIAARGLCGCSGGCVLGRIWRRAFVTPRNRDHNQDQRHLRDGCSSSRRYWTGSRAARSLSPSGGGVGRP
ncbi:MAG: TetR/AcrR family transcriptional regulator [Hyphomonas sp.]|nr:TetR/AcrR family transcriptional regulator [Hyphomonas sp.]